MAQNYSRSFAAPSRSFNYDQRAFNGGGEHFSAPKSSEHFSAPHSSAPRSSGGGTFIRSLLRRWTFGWTLRRPITGKFLSDSVGPGLNRIAETVRKDRVSCGYDCGYNSSWSLVGTNPSESGAGYRGIDFLQVAFSLFDGRPLLTVPTPRSEEKRYLSIGLIEGEMFRPLCGPGGKAAFELSRQGGREIAEEKR